MTAKHSTGRKTLAAAALALALGSFGVTSMAAATFVIRNTNAAGVGFNDPTPAAPVGGNTGTTLGQQRINAFMRAAAKWGTTLTSDVQIVVDAAFVPLDCTANAAVLGAAGPAAAYRDFPGAQAANTIYGAALANKLARTDLEPNVPEIQARFNVNLGTPGCLTGTPFYLGLDNQHGRQVDLITVLLHEFGHGLGFLTFTNGQTGAFLAGSPSITDYFLLDTTTNLAWSDMTDTQRRLSALSPRKLVWQGIRVLSAARGVLDRGSPVLNVTSPSSVAGSYMVGMANIGPAPKIPGVSAQLAVVTDSTTAGNACAPLNAANTAAVTGKIALVDVGVCALQVKIKNVQNAGALAAIIANTAAGSPPNPIIGDDKTVTIPSVRISLADATRIKSALATSAVSARITSSIVQLIGADSAGRVFMYTPDIFQPGSSVSHWDISASPNVLMEPAINGDLFQEVAPPRDLTFPLLRDLGW